MPRNVSTTPALTPPRLDAPQLGVDAKGESMRPVPGRLLVATPPLVDPNFDRTVVLMLEHSEDGAIGVVLNRPSDTPIDDVLPEWRSLAAPPSAVFVGGPVSPDAVIALGRAPADRPGEGFSPILG